MAGIFPFSQDGGLAPNPAQPNNPAQAFDPVPPPQDTGALYYGNGCDVRLRPHVVNSLISEVAATASRAAMPYRAASLQNLETAVRYLIQRGIPRGGLLLEQTETNYTVILDPPLTAYNDFLTLSLVPSMHSGSTQNTGLVRVNINARGYVPILRNDGHELRAGDLRSGIPFIAVYYGGAFYLVGLANSQVPIFMVGEVDGWIRIDGNDTTGDGTANSADKAFRTIRGAYDALTSRYAASPQLTLVLRLGIPGLYDGANLGPFGGTIYVVGDINNPAPYQIGAREWVGHHTDCVLFENTTGMLEGVTLVANQPSDIHDWANLRCDTGSLIAMYCAFEWQLNVEGGFIRSDYGAKLSLEWNHSFNGNGHSGHFAMSASTATLPGSGTLAPAVLTFTNANFDIGGFVAQNLGSIVNSSTTIQQSGCTGPRYLVQDNSLIRAAGQTLPGSTPGLVLENGVFAP